jgi:acid phosphatase family membrane protein YuiD
MSKWWALTPFLAWLVAGGVKFVVNCWRERRWAFELIGYGGWPSNHSCIVSSVATVVGLNSGLQSSSFLVALGLAFIVVIDAMGLRRQVGKQAAAINELDSQVNLRTRMGHSRWEVLSGLAVGFVVGTIFWWVLN